MPYITCVTLTYVLNLTVPYYSLPYLVSFSVLLLCTTLPDLTLNQFMCRMGKTDVRGTGESSESSQTSRGGMSEAVLPFGATLNPLLVHLPSQVARPPTLRECQVIARHLQLINNRQAHEVLRGYLSSSYYQSSFCSFSSVPPTSHYYPSLHLTSLHPTHLLFTSFFLFFCSSSVFHSSC